MSIRPGPIDDYIDDIRTLIEKGCSIEQTAGLLDLRPETVWAALCDCLSLSDLDPRPQVHLDRQRVSEALQGTRSTHRIAALLGMSANEVRRHRTAISGELARAEMPDAKRPKVTRTVKNARTTITGVKNVYATPFKTYRVQIWHRGVRHHGGTYESVNEAARAARQLRARLEREDAA